MNQRLDLARKLYELMVGKTYHIVEARRLMSEVVEWLELDDKLQSGNIQDEAKNWIHMATWKRIPGVDAFQGSYSGLTYIVVRTVSPGFNGISFNGTAVNTSGVVVHLTPETAKRGYELASRT